MKEAINMDLSKLKAYLETQFPSFKVIWNKEWDSLEISKKKKKGL
jgi:hypothetical protein